MKRLVAFVFFAAVFAFVAQFARAECKTIQDSLKDLDTVTKRFVVPARAYVWQTPAFGEWRFLYVHFPTASGDTLLVRAFTPAGCWLPYGGETPTKEVQRTPDMIVRLQQSELVFDNGNPLPEGKRRPS
jgi:hypothetical protein